MRSGKGLINSIVYIKSPYSEWGIVIDYDGEVYHVALYGDRDYVPIYDREDFVVPRNQDVLKKSLGIKH